jgi:hypothetical protein
MLERRLKMNKEFRKSKVCAKKDVSWQKESKIHP